MKFSEPSEPGPSSYFSVAEEDYMDGTNTASTSPEEQSDTPAAALSSAPQHDFADLDDGADVVLFSQARMCTVFYWHLQKELTILAVNSHALEYVKRLAVESVNYSTTMETAREHHRRKLVTPVYIKFLNDALRGNNYEWVMDAALYIYVSWKSYNKRHIHLKASEYHTAYARRLCLPCDALISQLHRKHAADVTDESTCVNTRCIGQNVRLDPFMLHATACPADGNKTYTHDVIKLHVGYYASRANIPHVIEGSIPKLTRAGFLSSYITNYVNVGKTTTPSSNEVSNVDKQRMDLVLRNLSVARFKHVFADMLPEGFSGTHVDLYVDITVTDPMVHVLKRDLGFQADAEHLARNAIRKKHEHYREFMKQINDSRSSDSNYCLLFPAHISSHGHLHKRFAALLDTIFGMIAEPAIRSKFLNKTYESYIYSYSDFADMRKKDSAVDFSCVCQRQFSNALQMVINANCRALARHDTSSRVSSCSVNSNVSKNMHVSTPLISPFGDDE